MCNRIICPHRIFLKPVKEMELRKFILGTSNHLFYPYHLAIPINWSKTTDDEVECRNPHRDHCISRYKPIDIREITFYLISNTFPEQNEACVQLYIVQ